MVGGWVWVSGNFGHGAKNLVVALEVALPAGQQVDMHVWNALPRVRAVLGPVSSSKSRCPAP